MNKNSLRLFLCDSLSFTDDFTSFLHVRKQMLQTHKSKTQFQIPFTTLLHFTVFDLTNIFTCKVLGRERRDFKET